MWITFWIIKYIDRTYKDKCQDIIGFAVGNYYKMEMMPHANTWPRKRHHFNLINLTVYSRTLAQCSLLKSYTDDHEACSWQMHACLHLNFKQAIWQKHIAKRFGNKRTFVITVPEARKQGSIIRQVSWAYWKWQTDATNRYWQLSSHTATSILSAGNSIKPG